MQYQFTIHFAVDGEARQYRSFTVTAGSLVSAVNASIKRTMRELPAAKFAGLTYYYLPADLP